MRISLCAGKVVYTDWWENVFIIPRNMSAITLLHDGRDGRDGRDGHDGHSGHAH